ncbi:hypothetical protein [Paenibacillus sp. KR2-11]
MKAGGPLPAAKKRPIPSIIWGLLFLAAGTTVFYATQMLNNTYAVVTLESKGREALQLRREDGSMQTVSAPDIVLPLLKEGEKYVVTYRYNRLRKPFLAEIEPYPG